MRLPSIPLIVAIAIVVLPDRSNAVENWAAAGAIACPARQARSEHDELKAASPQAAAGPQEAEVGASSAQADAQEDRAEALRLFLDCGRCDLDYLRREITFVNYVRDRSDAQVHVLVSTQSTGGGTEFRFSFIGREEFEGTDFLLEYNSSGTDTQDETRHGIAQVLRVGLLNYLVDTPLMGRIEIVHDVEEAEELAMAQPEEDRWNFWVFRAGFNGLFNGEQRTTSKSVFGSLSANRTTEDWKIRISMNGSYRESTFELGEGKVFVNTSRDYSFSSQVVKSLGERWGASIRGSGSGSTFVNQDLNLSIAPGIEYNIYPYSESSRRQFTFTYEVGSSMVDYEEETLFGKTSETLFDESVIASFAMRQPWGESSLSVELSHFFQDLEQYRAAFFGSLDFRVVRGLSLNMFGSASLVGNQRFLPRAGLSDEEILLRRRALETSYDYFISFGFNYTFGSIYNNVVNPRFGGSRGGIIRIF